MKKILAYNLPAFHRIPENDEWWGEGFTEWDNVRRGKPLFNGHQQPMIPIDGYYYDLSKKEDVLKQVKLASEYGIYGFIYYHYWFGGRTLLEKPIELYYESKEPILNYCFCWANETWSRTWEGRNKDILIKQTYGNEEEWEDHINYLISFFSDDRYIKIENEPVLLVYSIARIPNFDRMFEIWLGKVREKGFDGIYLIETISPLSPNVYSHYSKAVTEFEPMYSIRYEIPFLHKAIRYIRRRTKMTEYIDYDMAWKCILNRKRVYDNRLIIQGSFCQWDNSPRKGRSSIILKGGTPEKFETYFGQLLNNVRRNASNEYYIINAWNEWGEGAILEPTEQYKYRYLEIIQDLIRENI